MRDKKKKQRRKLSAKVKGILLVFCLAVGISAVVAYAEGESSTGTTDNRKLQNGSFEEGQTFTGSYSQPDQMAVPSWNTTAFQGKIELFRPLINDF